MAIVTDRKDESARVRLSNLTPENNETVSNETLAFQRTPEAAPEWSPSQERQKRIAKGFDWPTVIWLGLCHVGLLAAPFTFSWSGLAIAAFLHWMNGSIGICLGYHRLLTHSGFKTYPWVRHMFAWVGGLAGEGSAIDWIANHRKHHAFSDQDGDPHSPRDGGWWSHAYWLAFVTRDRDYESYVQKWAPDLYRDPVMRFIGRMFLPSHFLLSGLLFGLGYYFGGSYLAWSWLVWGVFVRLVAVLHTTWFVNSASHIWGYKNYETADDSKNLWWVALIAYGEGWHNNHHAYPRMAKHGHRWWEIDVTYMAIRVLKLFGLAWDVVDYKSKAEQHRDH